MKYSQKTLHSSPERARYGVSFVSSKGNILCRLVKIELYKIFAIINRAIKGLHCNFNCQYAVFLNNKPFHNFHYRKDRLPIHYHWKQLTSHDFPFSMLVFPSSNFQKFFTRSATRNNDGKFNFSSKMSLVFILNPSDAEDGILWLWVSIPCLLMHWLLKSPAHQQTWYSLCRTDNIHCCSRINFIYLGQVKSMIRFKMWIYLLIFF